MKIPSKAIKLNDNYPDWYWQRGLHDAKILSVSEPVCNVLEINLNSSSAIFEFDIEKITLFNYKIYLDNFCICDIEKTWWMGDSIYLLPNNKYLLEIETAPLRGCHLNFMIECEKAVVKRK